ncbi:MAG: hypothetical protein ACLVJ6_10285 [Merdibacter sp.]
MSFASVFLIGVSLSMDAFAVSIAKGMCIRNDRFQYACMLAFWFVCSGTDAAGRLDQRFSV